MTEDIRWQQRFQNFDRAINLLREPIERGIERLSALEKEGTVQRFEFAVELAWKTMKDYLEFQGQVVDPATPRTVVKAAFAARIVSDGQVWIDMLTHRNLLSHAYDEGTFDEAVRAVRDRYLAALTELHGWLQARRVAE